jgi:tRNA threonylcarbamoyladenosine biosynthesis protein TsaE
VNHLHNSYHYHAASEEDTVRLAGIIAAWSYPGMVITLDGDLGAGKTRFSKAFAESIGVTDVVSSPTFTLIKEYQGTELPLYHMDVYRITLIEADDLGLDEYFYGSGVSLVEWASRISDILPTERLGIRIEDLGGLERNFELIPYGERYRAKCANLKENGVLTS